MKRKTAAEKKTTTMIPAMAIRSERFSRNLVSCVSPGFSADITDSQSEITLSCGQGTVSQIRTAHEYPVLDNMGQISRRAHRENQCSCIPIRQRRVSDEIFVLVQMNFSGLSETAAGQGPAISMHATSAMRNFSIPEGLHRAWSVRQSFRNEGTTGEH